MKTKVTKLFSNLFRYRSIEAASPSPRAASIPRQPDRATAVHRGFRTVRDQARALETNNPIAASAVSTLSTTLIGTGIKPQSRHPTPAKRTVINRAFETWTDQADFLGSMDFQGLQDAVTKAVIRDGEAFVFMATRDDGSLALQLIDPAQVADRAPGTPVGHAVHEGIETDGLGRVVAYHVKPAQMDGGQLIQGPPRRIDAEDMIHIYRRDDARQLRGLSWLAPVILPLTQLDGLLDAEIMKQRIAACFMGVIVDGTGTVAESFGSADITQGGIEPGTIKRLPQGAEIAWSNPPQSAPITETTATMLRLIAGALPLTAEQLSGDYSRTNYSSARAALITLRRQWEAIQHNIIIFQFCRPVWRRWITLNALAGADGFEGYDNDPQAFEAVDWVPPAWEWVDPQKDIAATDMAISAGLISRREAVAARGRDIEDLDAEIAADQARAAALGLALAPVTPPQNVEIVTNA